MPNHVFTKLEVVGKHKDVKQFAEKAQIKGMYDFKALYPMPKEFEGTTSPTTIVSEEAYKELIKKSKTPEGKKSMKMGCGLGGITAKMSKELIKKYGTDNWYDWANTNWGTKWGCYDSNELTIVKNGDKSVASVHYQTAWSPATAFYLHVSKQFPTLKFTHYFADEGGGFLGSEIIQDGTVIGNTELEWKSEDGIRLRELLGCYCPEDEEEEEEEA